MMTREQRFGLPRFICLAAACALFVSPAQAGSGTAIEEVVIYGVDGDTDVLMRYTFGTDSFNIIGVVTTADGKRVDNTEALTWIPSGPAKGMYCAPRDGSHSGKLLRINPLDASAEVVCSTADDITAMVSMWNGSTWVILAWDTKDGQLVVIDPLARTTVKSFKINLEFEGFAVGPDGTFYANTDTALYRLNLGAGTATKIGNTGTNKMESLEYAFGDNDPRIDINGVPSSWTADGALMGFDDASDAVIVIDPASGATRKFPCSFATVDCEGLVMMTLSTDPYGSVVVDACD